MWETPSVASIVKSSNGGFPGIKAFVKLKASKHVVEVEVRWPSEQPRFS